MEGRQIYNRCHTSYKVIVVVVVVGGLGIEMLSLLLLLLLMLLEPFRIVFVLHAVTCLLLPCRSRKAMGPGPFEAAVTASLEKSEASALLAALATPNRGGTAGGAGKRGSGRAPTLGGRGGGPAAAGRGRAGRPSIREQMMAARRQQDKKEAKGGGAGGAGEGFVVVT